MSLEFHEVDMMILRVIPGDTVILTVKEMHTEQELAWLSARFKAITGLWNNAVVAVNPTIEITTVRPDEQPPDVGMRSA